VILRQTLPLAFGEIRSRPPPHLRLAVGISIGLHVVAVAYVAYTKFNPPIVSQDPPEVVYKVPLVDWKKPPPPEPNPPKPAIQPRNPTPLSFEPPLPPIPVEPTPTVTPPPIGPVATLDPPKPVPPQPRDPIIRDPRWVSRPNADEFARFYPERALRMGKEGEATLRCQVAASGQLHDCQVSGETPENFGFGRAAIQLARYMKIAPKTIDGQPVDGGILVEPIKFRLK
jgi:protein TonB